MKENLILNQDNLSRLLSLKFNVTISEREEILCLANDFLTLDLKDVTFLESRNVNVILLFNSDLFEQAFVNYLYTYSSVAQFLALKSKSEFLEFKTKMLESDCFTPANLAWIDKSNYTYFIEKVNNSNRNYISGSTLSLIFSDPRNQSSLPDKDKCNELMTSPDLFSYLEGVQENNSDRSFIVEKLVVSFNSLDYALPVLCYVARCILTEINNPRYEISIKINKPTNTINVFLHLYKLTSLEFYQFLFLYKTILANYRKKDLNVYMRLFQIQRNYIFPFAISQEMLRSYYDTCKAAKQFDVLQPNKSENLKTKLNVVHKSTEESFAILLDKKKDSYTISITTNMTQILEDYVHKSAKTFANAVTEKEMNLLKEANFLEVDGFVISHLKSINLGRASSLTGTEDYSSNCCLFNYFLLKKIYPGIKFDRDFLLLNLIFFRSLKDLHEPTSLARNLISSNWLGNQSFVYNFQNVIVDYKKKVLRERDRVVLQEKIQYLQALGVIIIEEQNEYQMILKFSQKTLMTLERGLILDEKLAFKIFEDIKFISSTKTSGDLLLAIFEEKMFHQDMYFPYDVISKDAKEKFSGFLEKCKKNEVILIPKELKTSLKKVKKKKEGF